MRPAEGMHPARRDASGCSDRCKSVAALWNRALAQVGARSKCVTQYHLAKLACRVPAVNASPMPERITKCCRQLLFPKCFHRTGVGSKCEQQRASHQNQTITTAWTGSCKNKRKKGLLQYCCRQCASARVARRARKRPRFAMAPKTRRERKCTNSAKDLRREESKAKQLFAQWDGKARFCV